MNCCGVGVKKGAKGSSGLKKGSRGNLEATGCLPVLHKLMLFFVRLLPSSHMARDRVQGRIHQYTVEEETRASRLSYLEQPLSLQIRVIP